MIALVSVATLSYTWVFLREPLIPQFPRFLLLRYLLLPDELFAQWTDRAGGLQAVWERLSVLAVVCVLWLSAGGTGYAFLKWLRVSHTLTRMEKFVLSVGIGYSFLSLLALALGILGWLHTPVVIGSLIGMATCGLIAQRYPHEIGTDKSSADSITNIPNGTWQRMLPWLAAPFAITILLSSILPPTDFDVREYHLQVPKEWFQNGRVEFLPHNVYGNMPLGAEIPSMLAMAFFVDSDCWWWGALAGKVCMGCFAMLTAMLLYASGRRFFGSSPLIGSIAAIVYISSPWVGRVSMNGLVEGVWAFYFFASLYVLLLWRQRPTDSSKENKSHACHRWTYLVIAGWLGGTAVTCKYPAVLLVVVPLVLLVVFSGNRKTLMMVRLRWAAIYLFVATVTCGPWFAKNVILAGNPTYPLLANILGGKTRTPAKNEQWNRAHRPPGYNGQALAESLRRVMWKSRFLSMALAPFIICSLLQTSRRDIFLLLVLLLLYGFAIWWLLTHRIDRFLVPMLPLAALLAGMGACWSRAIIWRVVATSFLAFSLTLNFFFFGSSLLADNRYLASLSSLRTDELFHNQAHRYFQSEHFEGSGVVFVGDAQPFAIGIPVLYNTCFDDNLFEQMVRDQSAETCKANLREANMSHIYVDWREIGRYRQTYGFSDFVQPELFVRLVQEGVLEVDEIFHEQYDVDPQYVEIYRVHKD